MKDTLIKYVLEEIIADPEEELMADDDLLNGGLIDSLGIMRLIAFIENEFGMKIPPQDMVIENFMSVEAIVVYIQKAKAL